MSEEEKNLSGSGQGNEAGGFRAGGPGCLEDSTPTATHPVYAVLKKDWLRWAYNSFQTDEEIARYAAQLPLSQDLSMNPTYVSSGESEWLTSQPGAKEA